MKIKFKPADGYKRKDYKYIHNMCRNKKCKGKVLSLTYSHIFFEVVHYVCSECGKEWEDQIF